MVTATINRALSCERWPSQRRSGSQRTRRTRACYTEYLLTLPMPVIPDALQTDRKLRSFTMIFFIPVSTGTFLFRKDDLTADLSALRGLLSNCLLLCYRHDGQSYIFPSIFKGVKFYPLEDHKKITSFHRRTKPWNTLIHSHLWLIASGAQSLSTVWKSTYEESCTTAYSGCCSSFSWSGFLMEWSYTGCFSAINYRSRRFSPWHTAQE